MSSGTRTAVLIGPLLLLALGGVLLWVDRHFEESEAEYVASLVRSLGIQSILGVFAHPDDEILATGLLSDGATTDGARVQTVTLTRGEAGGGDEPISKPEHLGVVRVAELYKFGRLVGVDEQEVWDYPDGRLGEVPTEGVIRRLVSLIRTTKPDLLVTFEPQTGLTLHPDNLAAGTVAAAAVKAAADESFEPECGPLHAVNWVAYLLAPRRMLRRFGGEVGTKIADRQPHPNYAIPGNSRLKTRGWEVHESQRRVIREIFGVPPWLLYLLYDKEHYVVVEASAI